MSFKPFDRGGKTLGHSFETEKYFLFFGTRHVSREELPVVFPNYKFAFLKQVHGKDVPPANAEIVQTADAHFTSQKNIALVSQTADCIPILLANDQTVCAIHSGWRGTLQNIVGAAKVAFPNQPPAIAGIGPHILKESFEVGNDVARDLLAAAHLKGGLVIRHPDPAKSYFDLTEMVRRQLRKAFGDLPIAEVIANTQTDELYFSYRRGKQQVDRQYSFVVLKG